MKLMIMKYRWIGKCTLGCIAWDSSTMPWNSDFVWAIQHIDIHGLKNTYVQAHPTQTHKSYSYNIKYVI